MRHVSPKIREVMRFGVKLIDDNMSFREDTNAEMVTSSTIESISGNNYFSRVGYKICKREILGSRMLTA